MKTFKLTFVLLLLLGALSCKKTSDSTNANATVTTDQAADMVGGSLATNSDGLATVTDDVAVNAQSVSSANGKTVDATTSEPRHQECGTTRTDSVTRAGTNGSVTFNYFFKYSHTLNCNSNNAPDNLINVLAFHGSFDGPRLSTNGAGSATVTIAGLTPTATAFVINGEYKRSGSFQSKVGNKAAGNSNVDIVVTNLTLTKPTRKIASGSATISITGTWPKGAFSYIGTIVFNGNGTATATINGTVYTIDLATGVATKN